MTYSVSPQESQESVVAALRNKFPLIPIIPDGLPEGDDGGIKVNPDGSVKPFIVLWFHAARRTPGGRSFATTRLDQRKSGCDVVSVASTGAESRRILNGVLDFLIGIKPAGSGVITESDTALWNSSRPMDIANRPARFLSTSTVQWGINSQKIT